MGDQDPGFRIPQYKVDFRTGEPVVEGYQDGISQGGGEVGLQENMAVVLQDSHTLALLQPQIRQGPG